MSDTQQTPESGTLPGRHWWVEEPDGRMSVPDDPEWNRFSDRVRAFEADGGAQYERQDAIGTAYADDHGRETEEPDMTIGYDLQQFPLDASDEPQDASYYGLVRDEFNQPPGSLICVERTEVPGGNDGAGIRLYTVARGAHVNASAELDPSAAEPILMELDCQPMKVRSYAIHQLSDAESLTPTSTESDDDSIDVTIESEDAEQSVTVGMGTSTDTDEFDDIDAIWLSDEPKGDVTIESDDSDTVVMEINGGLTYSDDDQPVDGDRGVPVTEGGSTADPINGTYEHFVGDKVERPQGTPVRPRIQSGSWSVENEYGSEATHTSRLPTIDTSDAVVQVEADVAGPKVSHDSMMEALAKTQNDLGHELSSGSIVFKNATVTDSGSREREASGDAVAAISETFSASGDPAIELHYGQTLDEVMGGD